MAAPAHLTDAELTALADPDALLERAWALEPWSRYAERAATLDRLQTVLDAGATSPPPPGRNWRLELLAEQAIDAGRDRRLAEANAFVDQVVEQIDRSDQIALGRAMLASGQALAWVGTDEATRRANRAFAEAADVFAALGQREWQGSALLRRGYSACYQYGDVAGAEALIRQALETYEPDSERLPGALAPYADVLIDLGEFDRAAEILDQAALLAERDSVHKALGEIAWARARVAAGRGDVGATERLLREAEREAAAFEWFDGHVGTSYLLEATELLDRLGVSDQARAYFERARARAGDDNEEVIQTVAVLEARSGNPDQALEELQRVVRGNWLEKRVTWRHTLLTAWATFRGGRNGAGELAARGLQQASGCGTVQIAVGGEPDLVAALTPLAERAGSAIARELLLAGRPLLVRLFGSPSVRSADGAEIMLPPGKPGELVRLLALHEHGLTVDAVLEVFFPDASPSLARQRLRQVLTRLRAAVGGLVVRDGDSLQLLPAWVDVREFLAAANRVRSARGQNSVQLAYAALALHARPLLPSDPYVQWAEETREEVRYRHLSLLDLVAADARARGSHQEALTAMELALEEEPGGEGRREAISRELRALGHHGAAGYVARLDDQR
ncbi:MAG TPA: hypothetical protein VHV75_05975 [Solirubrobacteraceae bacterium]|nr:hypothetical protein [Solirubrobacteraceae bacterium]